MRSPLPQRTDREEIHATWRTNRVEVFATWQDSSWSDLWRGGAESSLSKSGNLNMEPRTSAVRDAARRYADQS